VRFRRIHVLEVVDSRQVVTRSERRRYTQFEVLNVLFDLAEHDVLMSMQLCMLDGDGETTTVLTLRVAGNTVAKSNQSYICDQSR